MDTKSEQRGRERGVPVHYLSALPWVLVAGFLGFVCEVLLRTSGRLLSPLWVTGVEVVVLHALGFGYIGFRYGRSASARLAGAALGGSWGWFFSTLALETWVLGSGPGAGVALRVILGALLPALAHRLVDPLLLRGPLGRLASYDPRYAYLVSSSVKPSSRPSPPPDTPREPRPPGP
jgi:hypothetical protein